MVNYTGPERQKALLHEEKILYNGRRFIRLHILYYDLLFSSGVLLQSMGKITGGHACPPVSDALNFKIIIFNIRYIQKFYKLVYNIYA